MMSSLSIQADPPKPVVQQAPAVASSVIRPQQAPQTRAPAVSVRNITFTHFGRLKIDQVFDFNSFFI
jgi:hypothetical protein